MKHTKGLIISAILISVFILGYLCSTLVHKARSKSYHVTETEAMIYSYSELPYALDSIESLSIQYHDTANVEMLHYMLNYTGDSIEELPYYVTHFGDTIEFNKENFYYYVAMYTVADNLLETRKNIINGLLLNISLEEQNKENPPE